MKRPSESSGVCIAGLLTSACPQLFSCSEYEGRPVIFQHYFFISCLKRNLVLRADGCPHHGLFSLSDLKYGVNVCFCLKHIFNHDMSSFWFSMVYTHVEHGKGCLRGNTFYCYSLQLVVELKLLQVLRGKKTSDYVNWWHSASCLGSCHSSDSY